RSRHAAHIEVDIQQIPGHIRLRLINQVILERVLYAPHYIGEIESDSGALTVPFNLAPNLRGIPRHHDGHLFQHGPMPRKRQMNLRHHPPLKPSVFLKTQFLPFASLIEPSIIKPMTCNTISLE
ncbi:MAG: hypothetical protein OXT74_16620, partial [Candidatus Poribacteria bacterium]|nr:hypothetical protein [Candidatus Poribacteria bacterium]